MSISFRRANLLLVLFGTIISAEIGSYIVGNYTNLGILFYHGEALTPAKYKKYISQRNPILGWPMLNKKSVSTGFKARIPRQFNAHCLSLYGDSFTYSSEVEAEFSWPNVISKSLNCDALNFGVGGYGTFQSYLRYVENRRQDKAKYVVLNHLSENISRLRNQYRNFLYPHQLTAFKPTVTLENDILKTVPLIEFRNYQSYKKAVSEPNASIFPYEAYLPTYGFANFRLEFPYSISLTKALAFHYQVKSKIKGEPRYTFHYRNAYDVKLTSKVMEAFIERARENKQHPILTIIPTCRDLEYFVKNKELPYVSLTKALQQKNVPFLDFGKALSQRKDFASFHTWFRICSAHPNKVGYKILGDEFVKYFKENF